MKDVVIVNLGALDADTRISDAMEITKALLTDLGYIKKSTDFVKILGHGDYAKHLTFKDIDAFSASAKTKMEKPGTTHSVAKKAPVKVKKDPKSKAGKLKTKTTAKPKAAPKKAVEKVTPKAEKLIETKVETVAKKSSKEDKPVAKKEPAVKKAPATKKPAAKKPAAKK